MQRRGWIISGRVQGVFFRVSTQEEALRLGVRRGHARNLEDGSVEVVAEGDAEALAALEEWLKTGPKNARVRAVTRQPEAPRIVSDEFAVL